MQNAAGNIENTLRRLEALLDSGVLNQAEVVSCSGLAEALRRPARVAIFGQSAPDVTGILRSMIGGPVATVVPGGPAIELRHGPEPAHTATFEDGSSLSQEGYPAEDLLRYGPLFLQIEAPLPTLASMSFLAFEIGTGQEDCDSALAWAAKRAEIAIFCAGGFGDAEAALWSTAPDRLKNHCYLVTTGDRDAASARPRALFDAVIHAPVPSEAAAPLGALRHRLAADIAAARQEDVDAAELFLRRFRRPGEECFAEEPAETEIAEPDNAPPVRGRHDDAGPSSQSQAATGSPRGATAPGPRSDVDRAAARALVSAPILHLKRRSRALAELLEWREQDEEWSTEVLEHCCETAEALRDLVASWPDDDPLAERLREAIDQACDIVVLLQVESGPDQAEDAARVLYQLRTDFEQEMAA